MLSCVCTAYTCLRRDFILKRIIPPNTRAYPYLHVYVINKACVIFGLAVVTTNSSQSQTIRAILGLRKLIVEGQLPPGERVLEQTLVDHLNVSRTPARAALIRVCQEGLLEELAGGGYVVSRFSETDVFDAIDIRGTLEGMAARLAAERGASEYVLNAMHRCVNEIDSVVSRLSDNPDLADYVRLNDRFHELLIDASQSPMLRRALERQTMLPFSAPNAFVSITTADTAPVQAILIVSQDQHRAMLEAIERRESARAQSIAIEHARSAWKFLRRVLQVDRSQPLPPSLKFLEPSLR